MEPNTLSPQPFSVPSRAQRFWRFPITRLVLFALLWFVFAIALSLLLNLCVHPLASYFHWHLRGNSEAIAFLSELILAGAAVFSFVVMVRWADRRSLEDAGFSGRGLLTNTALGFALGAALFTLVILGMTLTGTYHVTRLNAGFHVLLPLATFFLVAVFEEVVFRGYLFQTLESRWGTTLALVVSCLVFGLVHLMNPLSGVSGWEKAAGPVFIVAEAGIPLAAAFLLTRRLWLPIGLHWAWNFFEQSVYGTADSGTNDPNTLLVSHLTGPFALTGGPFGPEGSVTCLVIATAIGVWLLRVAIRRGQWRRGTQGFPQPAANNLA